MPTSCSGRSARHERTGAEPLGSSRLARATAAPGGRRVVEVDGGRVADRGEVHADVAEPRGAHGKRGSQQHSLVVGVAQLPEPERHVDVGGGQHARLVELAQQAAGCAGRAGRRTRQRRARSRARPPRSKRSLSASTSDPGGCQRRPRTAARRRPGTRGRSCRAGTGRATPAQVALRVVAGSRHRR